MLRSNGPCRSGTANCPNTWAAVRCRSSISSNLKSERNYKKIPPCVRHVAGFFVAESTGFEPVKVVTPWRFSKPLPSAARPTFLSQKSAQKYTFFRYAWWVVLPSLFWRCILLNCKRFWFQVSSFRFHVLETWNLNLETAHSKKNAVPENPRTAFFRIKSLKGRNYCTFFSTSTRKS